ncbi:MAG: hypothetical protein ACK55I_44325, partial [bacterium]
MARLCLLSPFPLLAVCAYPPHSCAPPSYCKHALVSPQRHRTAAVANSLFSRAGLTRHSLFGPDDQSSPSGQSRLNTPLLSPSQCLEHAFSPCA